MLNVLLFLPSHFLFSFLETCKISHSGWQRQYLLPCPMLQEAVFCYNNETTSSTSTCAVLLWDINANPPCILSVNHLSLCNNPQIQFTLCFFIRNSWEKKPIVSHEGWYHRKLVVDLWMPPGQQSV